MVKVHQRLSFKYCWIVSFIIQQMFYMFKKHFKTSEGKVYIKVFLAQISNVVSMQ